jgi:hypothetical protein
MNQTDSPPFLASVVFLRIQDFARRPVAEQARLRAQLEAVIAVASAVVTPADRLILDTPSGTAVVVLDDPKGALELAERSLAASAGLPMCIGVNYGPVQVGGNERTGQGLMGDGIASAATVAEFAEPSRLLVSRSFREALAEAAPGRDATMRSAGTFTDSRLRTHELSTSDARSAVQRRRRWLAFSAVGAVALIGGGMLLRGAIDSKRTSGPPAVLVFDIKPRGNVFIDGEAKGKSPPLTEIRVSPGRHRIEVRHPDYEPLQLNVDLKPGEQLTIRHSFAAGSPGEFFRGLRDRLLR